MEATAEKFGFQDAGQIRRIWQKNELKTAPDLLF